MNWRKERITIIELAIGMFALALMGFGSGLFIGATFGQVFAKEYLIYVFVGWCISMLIPLLIVLRYRRKPKQEDL